MHACTAHWGARDRTPDSSLRRRRWALAIPRAASLMGLTVVRSPAPTGDSASPICPHLPHLLETCKILRLPQGRYKMVPQVATTVPEVTAKVARSGFYEGPSGFCEGTSGFCKGSPGF